MLHRTPAVAALRSTGGRPRHGGYAVSQRIRKPIEEAFGWIKTVAGQEKTSFRGRDRVAWGFYLRCRRLQSGAAAQADSGGRLIAKVSGFAKAFAGRPLRRARRFGLRGVLMGRTRRE
jgi:hypothetical protein